MPTVTTVTIMSVTSPEFGTQTISSRVIESPESALAHLQAMTDIYPDVEPYYSTSGLCWRWTWESVNDRGHRCTDTVRIYPAKG